MNKEERTRLRVAARDLLTKCARTARAFGNESQALEAEAIIRRYEGNSPLDQMFRGFGLF